MTRMIFGGLVSLALAAPTGFALGEFGLAGVLLAFPVGYFITLGVLRTLEDF